MKRGMYGPCEDFNSTTIGAAAQTVVSLCPRSVNAGAIQNTGDDAFTVYVKRVSTGEAVAIRLIPGVRYDVVFSSINGTGSSPASEVGTCLVYGMGDL